MGGSAERSRRGETVENVALGLLAVVAGGAAALLITELALTPSQARRVGPLGLLTFLAVFVGVGRWLSWRACVLAVLFGASFVPMTGSLARPGQLAGFLSPLVLAASCLAGALVGVGLGAFGRRRERTEDPATLAARRRRQGVIVMASGVALALVPFAIALVLRPRGEEGLVIGFMVYATWPIALLLLALGVVMLGRR